MDYGLEPLRAAVSPAANLQHLDFAVGAFGVAVVGIKNDRVDDPPQMLHDH